MDAKQDQITPELLDALANIVSQMESNNQEPELTARLKAVHRQALRYSMEMKFKG
jgi:hypothetical protein